MYIKVPPLQNLVHSRYCTICMLCTFFSKSCTQQVLYYMYVMYLLFEILYTVGTVLYVCFVPSFRNLVTVETVLNVCICTFFSKSCTQQGLYQIYVYVPSFRNLVHSRDCTCACRYFLLPPKYSYYFIITKRKLNNRLRMLIFYTGFSSKPSQSRRF